MLTITVTDSGLTGGSKAINYTVQSGDTLTTIATKMAEAITVDTDLQALTVSASSNGAIISIKSTSPNVTSFAASTSGGATTAIAMGVTDNVVENASIGGTRPLETYSQSQSKTRHWLGAVKTSTTLSFREIL
ncbi:MAG: LysM peptidoglycan-binding domain-containing protein [Candidatus Obscuribacter sp.]|nr:LysM peptidoglycan-binding domain-containing protein [Candidatus Obscuribacter sp.]